METSAKTGYNITDSFMALSETIFNQLEKGDINPMDDVINVLNIFIIFIFINNLELWYKSR